MEPSPYTQPGEREYRQLEHSELRVGMTVLLQTRGTVTITGLLPELASHIGPGIVFDGSHRPDDDCVHLPRNITWTVEVPHCQGCSEPQVSLASGVCGDCDYPNDLPWIDNKESE